MEQLNEIIGLIGSIIATIFLPILGVFMFYDAKKRKENAAVRKAEAESKNAEADSITHYAAEWKELYEKKEAKVIELESKIETLFKEKAQDRERIRGLLEENSSLKLKNQALEFLKCNNSLKCIDRDPPNEFIKKATNNKNDKEEKK